MAWSERQTIRRIIRKTSATLCATAYALAVEHGATTAEVATYLGISQQTAKACIKAGRYLNDNDAFCCADVRRASNKSAVFAYHYRGLRISAHIAPRPIPPNGPQSSAIALFPHSPPENESLHLSAMQFA